MKNQKLKCVNVETRAYDDQVVTLVNESMVLTMCLKNGSDHGSFQIGKEYPVVIPSDNLQAPKKTAAPKKGK